MPKIVKPMDPIWIVNYNSKVDTLKQGQKDDISKALAKYEKDCDAAADACNAVLLAIVPA
jgi:hypothetical protein